MAYRDLKKFREARKQNIIISFGGKCQLCGYDKCQTAFDLHHIDSLEKEFAFSNSNIYANLDKIAGEAHKCALLCSNCHREVHAGMHDNVKLVSLFDKQMFVSFYIRKESIACETCGKLHKNERFCSKRCLPNKKFDWDIDKLLKLHNQGINPNQIAKIFNVSNNSVRKKLKKLKVI